MSIISLLRATILMKLVEQVTKLLDSKFSSKDHGDLNYLLGMDVQHVDVV